MSEYFTEQEFEEYLDKLDKLKPLNDKEWKEFQYIIRSSYHASPNEYLYKSYLDKRSKTLFGKYKVIPAPDPKLIVKKPLKRHDKEMRLPNYTLFGYIKNKFGCNMAGQKK